MLFSPEFGFEFWVQVGETHCWEDVCIYGLICVSFSQSDWVFGFLQFGSATDASLHRICTLCGSPARGRCRIWSAVGRATWASSFIDGDGGSGANLQLILLYSTGIFQARTRRVHCKLSCRLAGPASDGTFLCRLWPTARADSTTKVSFTVCINFCCNTPFFLPGDTGCL